MVSWFDKSKTSRILIIIYFTVTNPTTFDWKTNCECNPEPQSNDSDGNAYGSEALRSDSLWSFPPLFPFSTKGWVNLNFIAFYPQGNIK